MIDSSKIIDNMEPIEFRFQKKKEFTKFILPLTKYNEQYFLAKQWDEKYSALHYYIISDGFLVIGRFDVGGDLESMGVTYHIIDEFQNRGIGQMVLGVVVNDIFSHNVGRIIILPINERSASIALKTGFTPRTERIYELKLLDYQKQQSSDNGKRTY